MSSELAIEISALKKTYKASKKAPAKEALKSIDLKIKKGSFFGLLGPNGAGKSTIINIMADLVTKDSGVVKICGLDIDEDSKNAKYKIGIVPQEIIFDPFFTVYETLKFFAGYYGIRDSHDRIMEIVKALGLQDKLNDPPRKLSGGMKRRLLVAKALVHNPELLILDEPTAGVDVELRTQLWEYIKLLNKRGTTILLTTHYLEEAEELCDEIAIINHGQVIANDKTANLMKLLDSKQLIIHLRNDLKQVPANIAKKLDAKIVNNNQLLINYKSKETEVSDILAILQSENLIISDISTKQSDLEDIFKFLTKKQ